MGKVRFLQASAGVSAGVVTPLNTGVGLISVINPSDVTDWLTSGAGVTIATTTASTDLPLAGVTDTAIKITPVSGTAYAYTRWTMPAALKSRLLKVEWWQRPLAGYTAGDFKVEVYKNSSSDYTGTYTEFSLTTDISGTSSIPSTTGEYQTNFTSDTADYYELRIVRVAGTTALNIANAFVGPDDTALTNPMDSAGDMIYGGTAGVVTKLDSGSDGQLLMAKGAAAPEWTNTVTGLIKFSGSMSNVAVEDANDSNRTLTNSSARHIVYTGFTTSRDVTLPTTSILEGEVFVLENETNFDMIVKSSDGSSMVEASGANIDATIRSGRVVLRAKQATPTTPSHWQVIDLYERYAHSTTFTFSAGGTTSSVDIRIRRNGQLVTVEIPPVSGTPSGASARLHTTTDLVTRHRPRSAVTLGFLQAITTNDGGTTKLPGVARVNFNAHGKIDIYRDISNTDFTTGGSGRGLSEGITLSWIATA